MSDVPATPPVDNPSRLLPAVGDPVSSLWRRLGRGVRLLRRAADWDRFAGEGWEVLGVTPSPVAGGDGNREFLVGARRPAPDLDKS